VSSILVVCTGNICRSPMAEGLIRHHLAQRELEGIDVSSAGVAGWQDSPATPEAIQAMTELDIDIASHLARRLDPSMIEPAGLVLAMASEHADVAARLVPESYDRTFTLKEFTRLLGEAVWVADLGPFEPGDDPERRLRAAVEAASALRGGRDPLDDEDIADPIGLGIDSYRATAWEIETYCSRMLDAIFGSTSDSIAPPESAEQAGAREAADTLWRESAGSHDERRQG
jgi:protein-tyrosine phosphatase